MSSVQVAVGVVDGQVIAKWNDPTREIAFDPENAYTVGMALAHAAMEAHRGYKNGEDVGFIAGELGVSKPTITDARRAMLVGQVATILKTFQEQGKTPGYCAMHAVDTVLAETAK